MHLSPWACRTYFQCSPSMIWPLAWSSMISFLTDSTNDCFKIWLATKLLGYYIWHIPTFLLKDLAASSKLSRIFSNSSGRANSKSCHDMKTLLGDQSAHWHQTADTEGDAILMYSWEQLKGYSENLQLETHIGLHKMMGREYHSSYLSADFILKNSWCCFMAECNHKGQLICTQEPRNLLSFKSPIYKCKQHEFSVKMLGISHLSGLKIHIRVDTAGHVALVSDVMTIRD